MLEAIIGTFLMSLFAQLTMYDEMYWSWSSDKLAIIIVSLVLSVTCAPALEWRIREQEERRKRERAMERHRQKRE